MKENEIKIISEELNDRFEKVIVVEINGVRQTLVVPLGTNIDQVLKNLQNPS